MFVCSGIGLLVTKPMTLSCFRSLHKPDSPNSPDVNSFSTTLLPKLLSLIQSTKITKVSVEDNGNHQSLSHQSDSDSNNQWMESRESMDHPDRAEQETKHTKNHATKNISRVAPHVSSVSDRLESSRESESDRDRDRDLSAANEQLTQALGLLQWGRPLDQGVTVPTGLFIAQFQHLLELLATLLRISGLTQCYGSAGGNLNSGSEDRGEMGKGESDHSSDTSDDDDD